MKFRSSVLGGAISVVLVCGLGCAANGDPKSVSEEPASVESSGEALTVVEADEALGKLVAKFRSEGREITFELRLGAPMEIPPSEAELAADPMTPSYQVDARLFDVDGKLFAQQMGGDAFLDPTWDPKPRIAPVVEELRQKDFEITHRAESHFRALKVPAGLEQLRYTAIQIARNMLTLTEKPAASLPTTGEDPTDPGAVGPKSLTSGGLAAGPTSLYRWDYQIKSKGAFFNSNPFDHSAVLLRGWASSVVYTAWSCNHGACANTMATHCTMSGYRNDDGSNSRWFQHGGCSTGYYFSGAWPYHNCNGDTSLQKKAIYYDTKYATDTGDCKDASLELTAPGCH